MSFLFRYGLQTPLPVDGLRHAKGLKKVSQHGVNFVIRCRLEPKNRTAPLLAVTGKINPVSKLLPLHISFVKVIEPQLLWTKFFGEIHLNERRPGEIRPRFFAFKNLPLLAMAKNRRYSMEQPGRGRAKWAGFRFGYRRAPEESGTQPKMRDPDESLFLGLSNGGVGGVTT